MSFPVAFSVEVVPARAGIVCVALAGELDVAAYPHAMEAVALVTRHRDTELVVLDLRGLTFIDSSGLRLVLEAQAEARRDGFQFAAVPGPPEIQRVFGLACVLDEVTWTDAGVVVAMADAV